jgi:hypothetical protein
VAQRCSYLSDWGFMYFRYCTEVDYSLAAIEKRMVIDPCEQYERGLEVPFKSAKVRIRFLIVLQLDGGQLFTLTAFYSNVVG